MARVGPRKVHRYSLEFKRTAVQLSHLDGVEVQAVADALDIHPFMLSRWRKEAREGVLWGGVPGAPVKAPPVAEIKQLQALKRAHALLQEEHALLQKAIRFCSARRRTSSRSSTASGARSTWPASARSTGSRAPARRGGGPGGS
jgi:transposase